MVKPDLDHVVIVPPLPTNITDLEPVAFGEESATVCLIAIDDQSGNCVSYNFV